MTKSLIVKKEARWLKTAYSIESGAGEVLATVRELASGDSLKLAHVMAAGPELLEVAKRLAQEVEFGGASGTAIRAMLQDAHAAIQKAEVP